jgi:hypothetical protein
MAFERVGVTINQDKDADLWQTVTNTPVGSRSQLFKEALRFYIQAGKVSTSTPKPRMEMPTPKPVREPLLRADPEPVSATEKISTDAQDTDGEIIKTGVSLSALVY